MRAKAAYIWIIIAVVFVGGFLFYETSGLMGRSVITTSTVVASVNGRDILYLDWQNATTQMVQQQEAQQGRGLTLDERQAVEEQVFNEMVSNVLLEQEYQKRGVRVSDQEIVEMARFSPPPQFQNAPDFQTDGRFDPAKYQRFLASPAARQQGILVNLENYYRSEIPKQKLFAQVAGDAYVSDARLWSLYRDQHDSATVSFVAFRPVPMQAQRDGITDAAMRAYYDAHRKEFERTGSATLSIVNIPRRPTANDTAETLQRTRALREEIAKGAKFEDVARRESDDTASGSKGGDLGRSVKGAYVKAFDDAVRSLPVGTVSQPVKTEYGFHIIRVDRRTADTAFAHHILKLVRQSDTAATRTDRRADSLAKYAAGSTNPAAFDSAASQLGLLVSRISVREGQPAQYLGGQVPSASAWAFSGVRRGETSDLFDDETGYFLVRLDSITTKGTAPFDDVKEQIRDRLARAKALDENMAAATALATDAARTSLEAAAKAIGRPVDKEGPFSRSTPVIAFGFVSEANGAAFSQPVGKVGAPVRTDEVIVVMRVDSRVNADSAKWAAQKATQRLQAANSLRDQRVRLYLENLRRAAKIDDRRQELNALQRRLSLETT